MVEAKALQKSEKCGAFSFKAGGITLTILEPLRRWRLIFNGLLK